MSRQPLYLFLSAVAWAGFIVVTLWTVPSSRAESSLGPWTGRRARTPRPRSRSTWHSCSLFAVQHSAMARPQVKAWLRRRIPAALERTSYVLATDICLVLLLVLWQPWGGQVWHVQGTASLVLWSLCAAGWLLAITATFAVDHLELTGLHQAGWAAPREAPRSNELEVGGLHAIVRHPLMTGLLLAFWATPQMGASHILFAVAGTGYIAIGIRFEERDLRRTFGAAYDAYAARVPGLLPDSLFGPDVGDQRGGRRGQLGQAVRPDKAANAGSDVAPALTAAQSGDVQNALDTSCAASVARTSGRVLLQQLGQKAWPRPSGSRRTSSRTSSLRPRNSGEGREPRTDPRGGPLRINCMTRRQPTPRHHLQIR